MAKDRLSRLLCCFGPATAGRRSPAQSSGGGEGRGGGGGGGGIVSRILALWRGGRRDHAVATARLNERARDGRPHLPQLTDDSHALEDVKQRRASLDHDGLYKELSAPEDEAKMDAVERGKHESFMREALAQAEYALNHDETPVGCVFVRNNKIIGRGMNDTNRSLNGTRHAEFVAIASILEKHSLSIFKETDLYVTVEPCIMCASALRQYGIRRVYFGCANDRFGGTGGVLSIHRDRSIDPPYPAIGGIFREEAIMLLRRFYIQENAKAPVPHKKNRVLKEDIPPMQAPKSSFAHTPPLESEEQLASGVKPVSKASSLAQKIIPAVPILRPRTKVGTAVKAV